MEDPVLTFDYTFVSGPEGDLEQTMTRRREHIVF